MEQGTANGCPFYRLIYLQLRSVAASSPMIADKLHCRARSGLAGASSRHFDRWSTISRLTAVRPRSAVTLGRGRCLPAKKRWTAMSMFGKRCWRCAVTSRDASHYRHQGQERCCFLMKLHDAAVAGLNAHDRFTTRNAT